MNATAAVSQAPVANDPAQTGGAGSADSPRSSSGGQTFAAALSDAGPKPAARKPAASRVHGGKAAGGHLPVPGNLSPPVTLPVASTAPGTGTGAAALAAAGAATSAVASAPGAVGDVTSGGAPAAAPGVAAGTIPGAMPGAMPGTVPDTASGAAPGAAPGLTFGSKADAALDPAAIPGAPGNAADLHSRGGALDAAAAAADATDTASVATGVAQALGLPGSHGRSGTDTSITAAPGASAAGHIAMPPGTEADTAGGRRAIAGAGVALTSASATGAIAGSAAKPSTAATAAAATAAATSAPSTAEGGAPITTDATTQTSSAAALAAAVSGAVAMSDAGYAGGADPSSSVTDDLATPATGVVAPSGGALNGSGVPGALVGPAQALATITHAADAAAAPVNAQAVAALAGAGTPDKHSPDGSGNSLLTDTSGNSIAGTAQLNAAPGIAADANTAPTLKVGAAVETPEFGQGVADRVSWMVDNNLNGAKLQVNPPQLGPIEVRIAVQGDHAQVWLTSHSAVTRDALEASSPKLREMLGSQGFGQVSVDISHRSFQERSSQAQPYDWTPAANRGAPAAAPSPAAVSMPRMSSGAVDAYA